MDGRNIRRKSCLNRQQNRFMLFGFAAPSKAGRPRLELYTEGGTVDKCLQRESDETRQDGFQADDRWSGLCLRLLDGGLALEEGERFHQSFLKRDLRLPP